MAQEKATSSICVLFYSTYGHTYKLAKAVAEGVNAVPGCTATLLQVPEIMFEILQKNTDAQAKRDEFKEIPTATTTMLKHFDGIIVGTPTRFGNMCAQMRTFWDLTGQLWVKKQLQGKVGSVFVTSSTQHGGLESTALSVYNTFAHHGMIIVPIGYSDDLISTTTEIIGATPYGAGSISHPDGTHDPSGIELDIAYSQGELVAQTALALKIGRAAGK